MSRQFGKGAQLVGAQMVGDEGRERLLRPDLASIVMLVCALALLFSSVWSARNGAARELDATVNFDRLVKVATCFVVAYLFRSTRLLVRQLFPLCAGCLVLGCVLYVVLHAALNPQMSEYLPVSYLTSLFSGMGNGLAVLVAAYAISAFPIRATATAVPACFLLTEVVYFALSYAPFEALVVLRPTLGMTGLGLVGVVLARMRDKLETLVAADEKVGDATRDSAARQLGFLGGPTQRPLVMLGMFLVPFVFGIISQVGSTGSQLPGMYDVANEAAAIGVLFLLTVYGAACGTPFSFGDVLCRTAPLVATGCILMPLTSSWDISAGQALVKCGYALSQAMLWMLLARESHANPRRVCLDFGVFYGLFELGTLAARASIYEFVVAFGAPSELEWGVALLGLWLLGVYGFALYGAAQRDMRRGVAAEAADGLASANATSQTGSSGDPSEERLERFCASFGLSSREREVLAQSLHGYSMETIGARLCISRDTVKTHLQRIYRKVGVAGKQELISAIDGFKPAESAQGRPSPYV